MSGLKTRIFILAHGDQTRLKDLDRPKQLIMLNEDEALIERTLRLVEEISDDITIIAPRTPIWETFEEKHRQHLTVKSIHPGDFVLHGLWQTSPWWPGAQKLLVLLGDVVYSRHAIQRLRVARSFTFVGRSGSNPITGKAWGELFGLAIPEGCFEFLLKTLTETDWTSTGGKLWALLQRMRETWSIPFAFADLIGDYTDDIDTPEDLEHILPKLQELVKLDVT